MKMFIYELTETELHMNKYAKKQSGESVPHKTNAGIYTVSLCWVGKP